MALLETAILTLLTTHSAGVGKYSTHRGPPPNSDPTISRDRVHRYPYALTHTQPQQQHNLESRTNCTAEMQGLLWFNSGTLVVLMISHRTAAPLTMANYNRLPFLWILLLGWGSKEQKKTRGTTRQGNDPVGILQPGARNSAIRKR